MLQIKDLDIYRIWEEVFDNLCIMFLDILKCIEWLIY